MLPQVAFTYHEPTELLRFWLLERYESVTDRFDIMRRHSLLHPTRDVWEEAAGDDEAKREFVPVSTASGNEGERLIITRKGDAFGRFDNAHDPGVLEAIEPSHLAPDHMSVGSRTRVSSHVRGEGPDEPET